MMKKLILLPVAAILLASCTSTYDIVSEGAYKETNIAIKKELNEMGYMQANQQTHKEFDGTMETHTTTQKTTNSTTRDRDRHDGNKSNTRTTQQTDKTSVTIENSYKVNTYSFQTEAGDRVDYTVQFHEKERYDFSSGSDVRYCEDMEVTGCSTSNIHDYDKVCGDDGIVARNIDHPVRQRVKFFSELKASLYLVGTLVVGVVLAAVLAPEAFED